MAIFMIMLLIFFIIFIFKSISEDEKNTENKKREDKMKMDEKEKLRENVKYLKFKNNNITFKNGTIIHCLTEDESNFILNLLENYGYIFHTNQNLTEQSKNAYNIYKENTCYKILNGKIYIRDLSIFKETYIMNSKDIIDLINNNDKVMIHIIKED